MKTHLRMVAALAFFGAWTGAASAQVPPAQNKLLAKRAAEADAYRKLAETINGVQIKSDTYVRDFVTESDTIQSGIDTFVRGARFGQPRYWDDGACEIDAEVTVASLVTTLKELHTANYHGNSITTTDIEQITQTLKKDIIKVTGSGAPRPDLPPELPAGVEGNLTALPSPPPPTMYVPPIWKSVSAQERLMAGRAARLDAMRKLLERIKGLRLTSNTLVRDFVTEYDEIATHASDIVVGAQEVRTYLHDDELIVEVTMQVPVQKVITQIKELHTAHYRGNSVTAVDIENLTKTLHTDMFDATGSGTVRPAAIQQAVSAGNPMPDWIAQAISAAGECTDPAIETPQGRLKAARCAELDAKRKLAEQVYGLRIDSNTSVKDFVTQYDEINSQVNAVLVGAVADAPSFGNGVARVTVTIPATDVWRVVHQQITIVQRKGP